MDNEKMAQESPALTRAMRTAFALPHKVTGSATMAMLATFKSPESMSSFHEWRVHPTTVLMIEVLRELLLDPSLAHHTKQTPEIEYGVTQGIALATQLMNDPSSIFADLFSDPALEGGEELPAPTYDTPPDGYSDGDL